MTDFTHTLAAMRVYESTLPERNAAWDKVETNEDVDELYRCDMEAVDKVRDAYYEDTKAFNSREHCSRIAYSDMKRVALKQPCV